MPSIHVPRRIVTAGLRTLFARPDRMPRQWFETTVDEFETAMSHGARRRAALSALLNIYIEEPFGESGFWQRLRTVHTPTLFIWGACDRLVPPAFARHVTRRCSHLEVGRGARLRSRAPTRTARPHRPPDPPIPLRAYQFHRKGVEESVTKRTQSRPAHTRRSEPDLAAQVDAVLWASRALVGIAASSVAEIGDDVTIPQLRILVIVDTWGPLNLVAVARALAVNPSNASRAVDRLIKAGLLDRRESRADRRNLN